jgi:uncharacterized protein YqeY
MSIYDTIKEDFKQARRDGNKAGLDLLSTVIGEIDNEASRNNNKVVTDEITIKILDRFKKNLDEMIELTQCADSRRQLVAINSYLPKKMTQAEIEKSIEDSGHKTVKDIMQHLKTNHAGLYDGKLASEIAKKVAGG